MSAAASSLVPPPPDDVELVLDLSRLISRVLHATPTGIDRVELAYARTLQRLHPGRLAYGGVHPAGLYGRIAAPRAQRFLDAVERRWNDSAGGERQRRGLDRRLMELLTVRPGPVPSRKGPRAYIQASPHHLHRPGLVRSILAREDAAFVCLLHDLIPIEYPEYARPGGAALHVRRIETVARLADAVIVNSDATARSFRPYLAAAGRPEVPVATAHLGLRAEDLAAPWSAPDPTPYFVAIGTIEPRKNHLLLLNLWRSMAEQLDRTAIPRLVLIGRRGWENEQVIDMLERCPALAGLVEEHAGLPDGQVRSLLAHARGLLLPSFAEGFGMPVPEALALGVPVVCSDLPALREAGGAAPCYLDPLDGPAWRRAILALADPRDPLRETLRARIRAWRAPTWDEHLAIVLEQVRRCAR